MDFLNTILAFFESAALSVWSRVSGVFHTILNELPDDEITIIHDSLGVLSSGLKAGKPFGEAAADALTFALNQEGKELSKVGRLLFDAAIAKLEPPEPPAA
jgi:hypothetical protein